MTTVDVLAKNIEAIVAEAYRNGIREFYPKRFVNAGLGQLEDVLEAFANLQQRGRVSVFASVFCENGHKVWRVPIHALRSIKPGRCRRCDARYSVRTRVVLSAEVSDTWRELLDYDAGKNFIASEKKVSSRVMCCCAK